MSLILLASASPIRRAMLAAAGVAVPWEAADCDEKTLKDRLHGQPAEVQALALANAKARAVSTQHPQAWVIGADQMCVTDAGNILSKPGTHAAAVEQLRSLRDRTHRQISAVCLYHAGAPVWTHTATAHLTMRALTEDEIHAYLHHDQPYGCCGAYRFEGLGRHLFRAVDGDGDTIQGLPLVPLLAELHDRGLIALPSIAASTAPAR